MSEETPKSSRPPRKRPPRGVEPPQLAASRAARREAGIEERRLTKPEQRLQAVALLQRRMFDPSRPTIAQLAKELGLNRHTVADRLKLAREDGVPDEARLIVIRDMLPAAMAVVQEALTSTDMKVAMQAAKLVLDGLEAIQVPKLDSPERALGAFKEETLEVWRERIRVVRKPTDPAAAPITPTDEAIDAEVRPAGPEPVYLPAAGAERLSAQAADDTPGTGAGGRASRVAGRPSVDASLPAGVAPPISCGGATLRDTRKAARRAAAATQPGR